MYEKELNVCIDAVISASKIIMEIYNSNDMAVEIKSDNSPVTKADKAADLIIRTFLTTNFPSYGLLTEESSDDLSRLKKDYVFIVDPIDGTKEYIAHSGEFSVNIGLSYKHDVVMGVIMIPVTGEIYYGIKGDGAYYLSNASAKPIKIHVNNKTNNLTVLMSRCHANQKEFDVIKKHSDVIKNQKAVGATIKGCLIAKGDAEMSYRFSSNTKEWDTCAMQAIVESAGGYILKFDKTPIKYNREDVYNRDGYIIINSLDNYLL
ncbi:MAG TPA: 3'(2'),5'-bisphosphate nucleotidase CysQ [Firmicutes bacterium]|nr:3'(2'),5'-bisphosphate nucleotidase CysQ [Bacillota bacterium]